MIMTLLMVAMKMILNLQSASTTHAKAIFMAYSWTTPSWILQ
ncbi:hypothetical protein [Thiolapillus sp.]